MTTIHDVAPDDLIEALSKDLKSVKSVRPPHWAQFVKTGAFKMRPPVERDWWYTRAAAVFRKVYLLGPIGVNKLRSKYGGKRNRGMKPELFSKGSGSIIRTILQQLQEAGFVEEKKSGVHKGRILTRQGRSMLDKLATRLAASAKKAAPKPPTAPSKEPAPEAPRKPEKPEKKLPAKPQRKAEQKTEPQKNE